MKKSFPVLLLVLALSVAACSWGTSTDGNVKTTDTSVTTDTTTTTTNTTTTEVPTTNGKTVTVPAQPSFEDGQIYLQAIRVRDVKLCAKIQNPDLKARCSTNAKPAAK